MDQSLRYGDFNKMITLTKFAADKTRDYLKMKKLSNDHYLRVGVKGGGCSGFSFDLKFDNQLLKDDDVEFESNGIRLVTKEVCLTYLDGTEIDYIDSFAEGGYKFNNPNATGYCGCGKSFST